MKTVTTTELRKKFRQVIAQIERGEPVEITRRGQVFARLVAAVDSSEGLVKPVKEG